VPTPFKGDFEPDLSFIRSAAESIADHLAPGNLVLLESTSPVGTTAMLSAWLSELRNDLKFPHNHDELTDIFIAYCPERVLPGKILTELVENDRVVGGMSKACTEEALKLYGTFVRGNCYPTDAATAEMTKLTENAFRDVNIAFANELSLLADDHGVNVWELIQLANHHPRVNILNPGPGVGGHCIAVDPWFLVNASPEKAGLIRQARLVNDSKPNYVVQKVLTAVASIDKPVVACLGLSFKADVDDLRESPSINICERLAQEKDINLMVVEPHVDNLPEQLDEMDNIIKSEMQEAILAADLVLLLVDHKVFNDIPSSGLLDGKLVIDTRGQWR
jgi:UDP-N-acetyl-D-mannosaminuronic acid dehydrogenase